MTTADPNAPAPAKPNATVTDAGIKAGQMIGQPRDAYRDTYAVLPEGATVVDLTPYADQPPPFASSIIRARTAAALIDYVERHGTEETAIFADINDPRGPTVTAVIDFHAKAKNAEVSTLANKAGRLEHLVSYTAPLSNEWQVWNGFTVRGQFYTQTDFARFIEENRRDVVEPDGATLLEIVKTLEAKKGVDFKSGIRLDNGATDLVFNEQIEGRAGVDGKLTIPTEIALALPVFYKGTAFKMTAFFRYRIESGKLSLKIDLHRVQEIKDAAFDDIITNVRNSVGDVPVYEGGVSGLKIENKSDSEED